MNCARSAYSRSSVEEAVDVEVVERGLDLVEDVERARPGEEDGEQEGERGHRLLAARQQRQALHRLAGGRDLDLDAEHSSSGPPRPRPRLGGSSVGLARRRAPGAGRRPRARAAGGRGRRGTAARRPPRSSWPRPRRSPRTSRGSGGRCPGSGRCSSRSAVSRSSRWRSSSSTCASASSYSCWASGLTGPSCSRRRCRRSIRVRERRALPVGQRLLGRLRLEPELLGERARARASASSAWSRACCARTSAR